MWSPARRVYQPLGIVPAHAVPPPGSMALDHAVYRPRTAEASVLHLIIRQHLEDFLRVAANRADGAGLPEFIAREFRKFLTAGCWPTALPGCAADAARSSAWCRFRVIRSGKLSAVPVRRRIESCVNTGRRGGG